MLLAQPSGELPGPKAPVAPVAGWWDPAEAPVAAAADEGAEALAGGVELDGYVEVVGEEVA